MQKWQKRSTYGTQVEIRSHMGLLTNERVNALLTLCDNNSYKAHRRPILPHIEDFRSSLLTLWKNVFVVLEEEENKQIKRGFERYERLYDRIISDRAYQTKRNCKLLLRILDTIHNLIIGGLQKKRYLYRTEVPDIKGIETAIRILLERKRRGEPI